MKSPGLLRWAQLTIVAAFLVASLGAGTAHAQEEGYQLNRLTPSPAGDAFSIVEYPWYSGPLLAAEFNLDYALNSVVDSGGNTPIGHSQYARFGLATAFYNRFGFSLSLPLLLFESGTAFNGVGPSGTVLSDPRVGLRARIWGQPESAFSLSASTLLWIPIGAEGDHAGDKGPRILPRITAGGLTAGGRVRWGLNAGYLFRKSARLSRDVSPIGNSVGSEVQFAAGASYLDPSGRFSVGPEVTLSFSADSKIPDDQLSELLEVYLTGRYTLNHTMEIGLGAGTAIRGSGPPDARGLLTFNYTWRRPSRASQKLVTKKPKDPVKDPPADSDEDGIVDSDDVCPTRAGKPSEDALRHGCPPASEKVVILPDEDGHVGSIEVDDGTQIVLVDKAYASVEVNSEGKAVEVPPAPPALADKAIAVMLPPLPSADRDGDAILDADDACPDRSGLASADPIRNGCPPASEKVVILPDADGHVGSIEVDNGTTKTVIDKAYATLEVASDGSVKVVPPSASPIVLERSFAGIAAAMPALDSDGDSVPDAEDACPARRGPRSTEAQRSGCPLAKEIVVVLPNEDGSVGSLVVDDGKTQTVLDKAFARIEVGDDGQAAVVASPPAAVVLRSLAPLSKTLPKSDLDGDGIVDAHDACKDRKGLSSAEPQRHGCPKSVERIVLLADEDGHVGALEIGEGAGMVVLDKPYASAEVAADGLAIKVDGSQRQVDKEFADVYAIAKAAKKARPKAAGRVQFVVYFDEQATPTRDVDAQIDALVKELKGRDDYQIEVVGHTDATGSNRTNLRVGNARAAEIAKRLGKRGIPPQLVSASTRGSSEPAVEVVDRKVPEPLNRRVEIRIKERGEPRIIVHFDKRTRPNRKMNSEYRALAKQLRGRSDYTIVVVGHSDPTEDESLALKRATAVARKLRGSGISKNRIESSSKGASVPAVELVTPGTLQPLNRRVEIFVK